MTRSRSSFIFRFILKAAALAVYITLIFDFGTGAAYHMIAGIAVCVMIIAGLIADFSSMRQMRAQFKNYTLSTSDSIMLATATLIAVAMLIMLVSGFICRAADPAGALWLTAYALHAIVAYLIPLAMAVRIGAQFFGWLRCRREKKSTPTASGSK